MSLPIERLTAVAERGASGELICASPAGEVHVYLQRGRVAWATDSIHAFAFSAHLREAAGIDVETFRSVVEECRRDKRSLGETLIAWELASLDLVRASLAHQIRLAMDVLSAGDAGASSDGAAQVLFLERAYRDYDERLTFDLRDFLPPLEGTRSRPATSAAARGDEPGAARSKAVMEELAAQLRASIEGLAWVEVVDDARWTRIASTSTATPTGESVEEGTSPRVPAELARTTLLDGADFTAVRSVRSNVVGMRIGATQSIWCSFSAESTFGAVVAILAARSAKIEARGARSVEQAEGTGRHRGETLPDDGEARHRPSTPAAAWAVEQHSAVRSRATVGSWTVGEGADQVNAAIRSFLERGQDVLGAVVLDAEQREPVAGAGATLDRDRLLDVARRRSSALCTSLPPAGRDQRELESMGFYLRTMVSGEPDFWCFGAELPAVEIGRPGQGAVRTTLWMFVDRRHAQGIGWAYLTSLSRALANLASPKVRAG